MNCALWEDPGGYLGEICAIDKLLDQQISDSLDMCLIQNKLLLSCEWNIWISLISKEVGKGRKSRCFL